ncbi:Altered inheritance rate of mitochondria protein 25 [Zancudomyces culisetae]|uniref:Phospholipid scramblase n=1 Tax=Zancudomyces culisetae TaxID=1213189 RepID=A0A1R1PXG0_ZANCU|nr:Altered inheritance rate of mitochondria protein 25 [Zancudomyces culisetae]|eukprot:OMH85622.1 Altered inheritance rate of mitochondria protein 25 [Zancudomyces culisetae]
MNGNKIGETHQEWHPFRRRYNLFVNNIQFGRVDAPFLSWSFRVVNEEQELLASIDRGFIGFGMELLTDAGQYSLRMDPGILQRDMENGAISSGFLRNQVGLDRIYPRVLTYDERAVLLACAISVDFDYFSRHSSHTPYH